MGVILGITKSIFGTPYALGGDDFAIAERKNAPPTLNKLYIKDKQKIEVVRSFGIGMDAKQIMNLLSPIIFNHMSDSLEWPLYTNARTIAKGYERAFNMCVGINNLNFAQGCLMLRAIIWHMQTAEKQIVLAPLDDFPSQELWKMGEFLYEKHEKMESIYSMESQKEFKEKFEIPGGLI